MIQQILFCNRHLQKPWQGSASGSCNLPQNNNKIIILFCCAVRNTIGEGSGPVQGGSSSQLQTPAGPEESAQRSGHKRANCQYPSIAGSGWPRCKKLNNKNNNNHENCMQTIRVRRELYALKKNNKKKLAYSVCIIHI